jgi:DNA-binding NtrC family response regulator
MRVVVVEDQLLVRQLAEAMLLKAGHEVSSYTGMEELTAALAAQELVTPDLALVDLTLNDGDGVQAVSALRNRFGCLGVVLMSGYDSTDALTRIGDHRRLTFLKKPFTAELLDQAMAQVAAGQPGPQDESRSAQSRQ